MPSIQEMLQNELTKSLVDDGAIIEAGFVLFRHYVMHKDAAPDQVIEMRMAFMAGAQHVYASIMNMLDPGMEPTELDMQRMEMIHDELERVYKSLHLRTVSTKGSA